MGPKFVFIWAESEGMIPAVLFCTQAEAEQYMRQVQALGEFYHRDPMRGPDVYSRKAATYCGVAPLTSEFSAPGA